ncbi:MAG: DNA mismatch endonuclease Vsr [Clostridia bacterium]|nr:DNA mismatch endonuclease Vsr [Clostridia bacterium]
MADVFSKEKRSDIMRQVRSKGNKSTELKLIEVFDSLGIKGWRRNYSVIGHPDFVFLKQRLAVFVDGCFWHGHDCRNTRPVNHADYWLAKRERNQKHDAEINRRFESRGWTVLRLWECELKKSNRAILEEKLRRAILEEDLVD